MGGALAISLAAMSDSTNLDGVGIRTDEEKPVVTNTQPKFFSTLQSFHVAHSRFREAM